MPKRKCKFTDKLNIKYPCFRLGRDASEAECMTCRAGTYVSVANKGGSDLEAHVHSAKHKTAAAAAAGESSWRTDTHCVDSKTDACVSAAEGALAFHTVKHSSCRSMDCTSGLLRKLFPDSVTAQNISRARTKTEAIVDDVIAPLSVRVALEALEEVPYCGVCTDGCSHGAEKLFPLLIQYFDWRNGGLQSKLIEIKSIPKESADTITEYIRETLEKNGISSKCIAFTGDNRNTHFRGIRRPEEGRDVFANLKKSLQNKSLVGVGCPAHTLNSCVHHAADTLEVDIENIIFKMYQHFHIYTVRTERLKEYCEFADAEYRTLLSLSRTPWQSLFPGIKRLLQMFPALKAFFLSQEKPPMLLKKFFEDEFSEIYLWQMHSLMCIFQTHIQEMEREDNSVVEVKNILDQVHSKLQERRINNFMPLKVKALLAQKHQDGCGHRCERFSAEVQGLYRACLGYLERWVAPMEEFSSFMWMDLSETPDWSDVEGCIGLLAEKGVDIDDAKCFDQVTDLKKFLERSSSDEGFRALQAHQRWTKFFEKSKSVDFHSELLKIAQFVFAIPAHDASVQQIVSLMQQTAQWTRERNGSSVESLKGILCSQNNFTHTSCRDFHTRLMGDPRLLGKIQSVGKYAQAHQEG